MEHTAIRNIINWFAKYNDGYQVLYAMLELVHPALHKDAVVLPPNSSDCSKDVHLYVQKFDSRLRYEAYANRPYSARETINHFIQGLSTHFAPAVNRICQLMDNWNAFDTTVPEPLCITTLPNTVEQFMAEESGITSPIMRRMGHTRKGIDKDNREKTPRQYVDTFCSFCGQHGHASTQCDFMAQWLSAYDSLKKVDAKSKEQLQTNFENEQHRMRNKKLKKKVTTIRQLISTGGSSEEAMALLDSIPNLINQADDKTSTSEASSATNSDSKQSME